jgi:hypothetical protein
VVVDERWCKVLSHLVKITEEIEECLRRKSRITLK